MVFWIKLRVYVISEIVDGNVKAIMRLILALAAHYKPNSVKQTSKSAKHQTVAGIAQVT